MSRAPAPQNDSFSSASTAWSGRSTALVDMLLPTAARRGLDSTTRPGQRVRTEREPRTRKQIVESVRRTVHRLERKGKVSTSLEFAPTASFNRHGGHVGRKMLLVGRPGT